MVDQLGQEGFDGEGAARVWTAAVQAGDRDAFDAIVRGHQQQILGYLLNQHRLTHDQALDLTQQTLVVALGKLLAGGEPVTRVRAWLFAIARLLVLEQLRRDAREVTDGGVVLTPVPDEAALTAFVVAERDLDRELAVRRNLPTFLGLMHDAVESLPTKEREVIRIQWALAEQDQLNVERPSPQTIDALVERHGMSRGEASRRIHDARRMLPEIAAALLVATTGRTNCARLDLSLTTAGWAPGKPFDEELRRRVRQHMSTCAPCKQARDRALRRISALPVFVLFAVGRLTEHREKFIATAFDTLAPEAPMAAGGSGIGGRSSRATKAVADLNPRAGRRARRRLRTATVAVTALLLALGGGWAAAARSSPPPLAVDSPQPTAAPSRAGSPATGHPKPTHLATTGATSVTPTSGASPTRHTTGAGPAISDGSSDSTEEQPVDPPPDDADPPDPSPEITDPHAEPVQCGVRITAYITSAATAKVVYHSVVRPEASTELSYDGEVWSAVVYPVDPEGNPGTLMLTWQIEALNGSYDILSETFETESNGCSAGRTR